MCGIAGLWDVRRRLNKHALHAACRDMTNNLAHRGPDDEGHYLDEAAGLILGHRRLSIIDLSVEGHQPMVSASGRYVITYNGEVYNHAALRRDLEGRGHRFRGHSDTEVMLAAIEEWGLVAAIERFIGMFAFALWDCGQRRLTLVRDRLGIKPLYFGWCGSGFVFGSELKAVTGIPGFENEVSRDALTLLLRRNYIPAPYSIYERVYKLMPGTVLDVDSNLASAPLQAGAVTARSVAYWSALQVAESGVANRYRGDPNQAADELDGLLRDSVALRMVADVPLGAFLSGGIDSSTVVALMQVQSNRAIRTFSIGFAESEFDEAPHARAVARHLGTDHTELYVTPREAMDVIPKLPAIYDEPFADVSQIPTYLVAQLARQSVTVSLSGDGGDELFAGYNRYVWGRRIWRRIGFAPKAVRRAIAALLRSAPGFWGTAFEHTMPLLPQNLHVSGPRDKPRQLADVLMLDSLDELYTQLLTYWPDPASLVIDGREPPIALTSSRPRPVFDEEIEVMMFNDLVGYLPDDILTKVDRASMAVELEARVPLLDHRVVEFAWRLPLSLKIRDGESKWLLRQVLARYVPEQLTARPKQGFGVPIEHWLRGPLRDWAEALLDPSRLRREGYFEGAPIRAAWSNHLGQGAGEQSRLWAVLMFQAWLAAEKQRKSATIEPARLVTA